MKRFVLIVALLMPLMARSAWYNEKGQPITDTESRRSDGNFAAALILTPDGARFRQVWNSTRRTPHLSSINSASVGSPVEAMIVFNGCAPDSAGKCDVVASFAVESPDGKKTATGRGSVWRSVPPPAYMLQLGKASMKVTFDSTDSLGSYRIIADIKDKVSGRRLMLVTPLELKK